MARATTGYGGFRRQGIAGRGPKDLRGALDKAMNFAGPALVNVVISQGSARKAQESPGIADRAVTSKRRCGNCRGSILEDRHAGTGSSARDRDWNTAALKGIKVLDLTSSSGTSCTEAPGPGWS